MPSWKLHDKWAVKMGIPLEVSKKINELIDSYLHDLGERKRVPIGPPIPIDKLRGIYAELPKIRVQTESILIELITEKFSKNLINQALEAALLHHWLDKIAGVIRDYGTIVSENVEFVID